jgi:hypothetical protein
MALNKLKYNSLNLTPAANKAISFDSDADALEATLGAGAITFIKKLTASSSSDLSFVNGSSDVVLDSTYKEYMFIFNSIHPSTQSAFEFNVSVDSGSNYNVSKTTTSFRASHNQDDDRSSLNYETTYDLANGTGYQSLDQENLPTDNDSAENGYLHLFNPSSTTFVKHFISSTVEGQPWFNHNYVAGYANTTSAINAIQFKMGSGTIDAGTITLYGIN